MAIAAWTFVPIPHTAAIMDPSSSMLVATDGEVIRHVLISRYFTAAAMVILLYDSLLTLNDEVSSCKYTEDWYFIYPMKIRLVWPGALTIPKLLYYINRYMAIIFLIAANFRMPYASFSVVQILTFSKLSLGFGPNFLTPYVPNATLFNGNESHVYH